MARLGTAVRRWTRTRPRAGAADDAESLRTDIALNRDGKLLMKNSWLRQDGRLDFTHGWKLAVKRRINDAQIPAIHKGLIEKGYVEVEV